MMSEIRAVCHGRDDTLSLAVIKRMRCDWGVADASAPIARFS